MRYKFSDLYYDDTKNAKKLKSSEYKNVGKHIIVDQGKALIAGYTDNEDGLYTDVPAIIFGDHTRNIKYIDSPFFLGADGTKVLKSPVKNVNYKYLYYLLKNASIPDTGYNRHFKWLKELIFKYHSQEQQNQIVTILDKLDLTITKYREELSLLDELVKARFVEMFGDPVHSEKYGTRKLSSCVAEKSDMVDGPFGSQVNTKVDYIENGEIPVIRTVNVKMMSFSPTDLKYMTREKYETVIRSQVLPGDVILTKVGTIGNVCIFPNAFDEAVLSTTGSCRIRVDNSVVNTQFFAYNLMYLKGKLLEIASAGVQPFLNMNHVKNIDILDVPLEKQKEFADFVKEVDKSRLLSNHSLFLIKSIIF